MLLITLNDLLDYNLSATYKQVLFIENNIIL